MGWRGPLRSPVSLMTGAWNRGEGEEVDWACWPLRAAGGRARINTTTAAERRFPLRLISGQARRLTNVTTATPAAPVVGISIARHRRTRGRRRDLRIPS